MWSCIESGERWGGGSRKQPVFRIFCSNQNHRHSSSGVWFELSLYCSSLTVHNKVFAWSYKMEPLRQRILYNWSFLHVSFYIGQKSSITVKPYNVFNCVAARMTKVFRSRRDSGVHTHIRNDKGGKDRQKKKKKKKVKRKKSWEKSLHSCRVKITFFVKLSTAQLFCIVVCTIF